MTERRLPPVVLGLMHSPFTWPILGGSMLAAVAVGIHLGESAIGMIKPIYFQGPALHPRDRGAAIDPSRLTPRPAAYASLYGWPEGEAAQRAECGDCGMGRSDVARAYSAAVPYFGGDAAPEREPEAWAEAAVATAAKDERAKPVDDSADRPLARYAHYPVSAEEAEAAPVEPAALGYGDVSYQQADVWLADAPRNGR